MNASEISNSDDVIADVWNEHNPEQVPDRKRGKYQNSFPTDYDRNLSTTKNISKNLKENFRSHKQKHNVRLTVYHEKYTKTLEGFLVDNKPKCFDEYEVEVLPKPSTDFQPKYSENVLNSINAFLLLLVIAFMG